MTDFLHSNIDFERAARQGVAEVIYAEHKTAEQVRDIAVALVENGQNVFATRATHEHYVAVKEALPDAVFDELAGIIIDEHPTELHPVPP